MKKSIRLFCRFSDWCKLWFLIIITLFTGLSAVAQIPYLCDFDTNLGGFDGTGNNNSSNYFVGTSPGNFQVITDPFAMNGVNFIHSGDHTTGTGKMMVVDGGNTTAQKVWASFNSNSLTGLIVGSQYTFTYYIKNVNVNPTTTALANIQISKEDGSGNAVVQTNVCPADNNWTKVSYTWVATGTWVKFALFDAQTAVAGNDFALDDISITKVPDPLTLTYSAINPTCPGDSDGFIVGYPAGGVPPYNFTLNGSTTNSTGIFTGLGASTNTISVTDAAATPVTVTKTGVTLTNPVDNLAVTANTPICSGASANLLATGGSSGIYNWTSNPPGYAATGPTPAANPTSTTTYIVTTTNTVIKELLYNGHFDNNTNLGFNSDYANIPLNDVSKVQKAFGIQANPKTFESGFSICPDHTTGSGNQMVVDGSTGANDRVWFQSIPVNPGTTYTFSYYAQTVSGSNPAIIETQINGLPITGVTATSRFNLPAATCAWNNITYTWNSGAATMATLALIDRNLNAAGNDFALDDLSFYAITTCTLIDSIQVVVNPAGAPVTGFSYTTPVCKNGTNPTPTKVPGFSNGGVFTATPAGLSINSSTGDIDLSLSTANTYTVTYTYAASSCNPLGSSNTSITITAPPSTGTLSGNQNICVSGTTTFSSTITGGTWSSGDITKATIVPATGVITGVAAGTVTMTYTVTGMGGCSNVTATRTVTVTDPPSAGTLSGSQNICVTGTTTFSSTISGGTWSSGDITKATVVPATGVITGVAAGTVTMTYTVTGTGGCSNVTATRTVTVTDPPIAGTLSGNQNICVGGTATFSSTITGGTWSSGDITKATIVPTTGVITGVAAGTVTMTYTVTGTGGCSNATATRTVTVTAAPTAGTLSGNQNICVSGTTTFSSTITGGTWSSGDITKATIVPATGVITGVAAGTVTMTYTVTGTGGCSNSTATRTVTVTTAPVAGTLSGNQSICVGGTTTFSSTIAGGTWSSGDITKATINSSTGDIAGVAAGTVTMTYTVTGTGGCSNATATRTVTVTAAPTAGTLSGNQNICVSGTTTFASTITGGSWSSGDITKATIVPATGVITGVAAGTVTMTYTVTGTGGCSNATATRTVTVTTAPVAGTLSGNQSICVGGTTTFSSTITGGSWSSGDITKATINSSTGDIAGVAAGTVTMTYTVTGTGGCSNATATRTVTVTAAPTAGTLSGNQNICVSGTTTFSSTISGGTWSSGDITKATIVPATGVITGVAAGTVTMTYTVTGTGGCSNATATRTVTVTTAPVAGTLSGNQSICVGGTTTFSSTASGGTWTSGDITKATINSSTGDIAGVAAGTVTMTYTVTGTGGCSNATATRTVTVTAAPTAGTLSGNQNICVSGTTTFASTITGGSWSSGDITKATIVPPTGVITGVAAGTVTMTYTVTGTGGCSNATATRTVTVTAAPVAGTLSGNQNICVGGTTTFSSTASGGTWTSGDITKATINSSTGDIAGVAAGTVTMTYTVTGAGGCSNATATRTVTITAAPTAGTLSGNQNICVSGTTTFSSTISGGTWSSGDITKATIVPATGVITGVAAGTVTMTYTVTGTGGCSNATATRTVTVTAAPVPGTLSGNQNICISGNATFSSTISGGTWSSGDITKATIVPATGVITGVAAGAVTMTYTVTGSGGCANATATRTVTISSTPTAGTLTGNQNLCIGGNTTFSSTIPGGAWSSSDITKASIDATTGVITGNTVSSATMTYTITGTGGCSNASATRTVTVNPLLVLSAETKTCEPGNASYRVSFTATTGNAPYTVTGSGAPGSWVGTTWTSGLITTGSTYSIAVNDVNNCNRVNVNGTSPNCNCPAKAVVSGGGSACADGTKLTISIALSGTPPWNIIYTDGTTSTPVNNIATTPYTFQTDVAGTYVVTSVSDATCTGTSSGNATVNIVQLPTATISGTTAICPNQTTVISFNGTANAIVTYTINSGPNQTITLDATGAASFTTPALSTQTTYALVSATTAGPTICTTVLSGSAVVTINPAPVPVTGFSYAPGTACIGDANPTLNPASGFTAGGVFSATPAGLTIDNSTGAINVASSLPNTYTITYFVAASGCSPSNSSTTNFTITGLITPVTNFSYTPNAICVNGSNPTLTTAPGFTTGGVYTAFPSGLIIDANTGAITVAGSLPNNYTIAYSVAATNCSIAKTGTATITINDLPATPFVNITEPTCSVPTGTITVTNTLPGLTYSKDGINYTNTTGIFSGLTAGSAYSITTKNSNGCISAAATGTIGTVPGAPASPQVLVTQPTCTTATATVSVTSGTAGFTFSKDGINYTNTSGIFSGLAAGSNYSITLKNVLGCISSPTTGSINTQPLTPAKPTIAITQPTCTVSTGTISVTSSTAGLSFSDDGSNYNNTTGIFPTIAAASTYSITAQNSSGCISPAATGNINVQPPIPIANAGADKQIFAGETVRLDGVATGNNVSILWTPNVSITGSNTATPMVSPVTEQVYTMKVTSADGCINTDDVKVKVLKDIIVPNVFSPNNDGVNDTWKITNIEDHPTATVDVFNRYGQFIFGSVGYTVKWDGTFKGQPVPVGAYYWIIKLRSDKKPMTGSISVVR